MAIGVPRPIETPKPETNLLTVYLGPIERLRVYSKCISVLCCSGCLASITISSLSGLFKR